MNQRIEYNVVEFSEEAKSAFRKSLEASFIGSEKKPDDRFAPRILSNNDPASNVLSVIKGEFLDCVSFDLSVAFITASGIQVLAEILSQLRQRGIKGAHSHIDVSLLQRSRRAQEAARISQH